MSELTIRIDKVLDSEGQAPPRVPARIYPIGAAGASSTPGGSVRRELVPISHDPAEVLRVDLAPGAYYVETVLPSGEILSDSVTLAAGESHGLVLDAAHSPHEWFAWQHLVGNALPQRPAPRPAPQPAAPAMAPRASRGKKSEAPAKSRGAGVGRARSSPPRATPAAEPVSGGAVATPAVASDCGRPIKVLSAPESALIAGDPAGAQIWKRLAGMTDASAEALIEQLNQGHAPIDLPVHVHDASRAVYRLSWQPTGRSEIHALEGRVPAPRSFVVVPQERRVELLSLPIPWHVIGSGREAAIEVAVQEVHTPDAFNVTATARDEQFGVLLGFLSSGSLTLVRDLAETARDLLFYKVENPFAAAAGGYAMVGTALKAEDREWHGWIRNLAQSFPHIPDGAIQWAQLRLRMRRSASDLEEAKQALKLAYRRGLPFYSMGVKWLMEGLEWIARGDSEAAQMLQDVRRVAWRTNFQQPFTIVRVGGESNV